MDTKWNYIDDTMHERCKNELLWAGKTLREASKCASVSVVEVDDDDDDDDEKEERYSRILRRDVLRERPESVV